jgi:hypothetical protein
MRVGVLHPGEMGVTVLESLVENDVFATWVKEGRSESTVQRASSIPSVDTLEELVHSVETIISVCPPSAALEVALNISEKGFKGIYVDANAISPLESQKVAELFGAEFVDGGIIGPPAKEAGTTRIYLSGMQSREVVDLFKVGPLEAIALTESSDPEEITAASALKMAYAGFSKGSSALLLAVNAFARKSGVLEALHKEWEISAPGLVRRSQNTAVSISRKAWRFGAEMDFISESFDEKNLPPEFHQGASALYGALEEFKDQPPAELTALLEALSRTD